MYRVEKATWHIVCTDLRKPDGDGEASNKANTKPSNDLLVTYWLVDGDV